jgi:hypothetical protein
VTDFAYRLDVTETELALLADGTVPAEVQAAALDLLRLANQTPAQAVEARPIPAGKACKVCGQRWAQPNTGGRCTGCARDARARSLKETSKSLKETSKSLKETLQ